jgi:hypothetical protein
MLKDIFTKETRNRDNLQYSTSRALSLGNDITAYGHSVSFVETTMRPTQDGITSSPVIYPAHALLDRIKENPQYYMTPKQQLKDNLTDYQLRVTFWASYKLLRKQGKSRRHIMSLIYEALGPQSNS